MSWKKFPIWFKGGVIAVILYLILMFLSLAMFASSCWDNAANFCDILSSFIYIANILAIKLGAQSLDMAFISIPFYIVLGVIIGWIVGKIKKNK